MKKLDTYNKAESIVKRFGTTRYKLTKLEDRSELIKNTEEKFQLQVAIMNKCRENLNG